MLREFAAVAEALLVEAVKEGAVGGEEGFGGGEGSVEGGASEMAFCGAGNVVVPDVRGGMVQGDAFEAVVEADGPVEGLGAGGEEEFGEVLPAGEFGVGGHVVFARVRVVLGQTKKGKGGSRFPAGMTTRKATARDKGGSRFPAGMTRRKATAGGGDGSRRGP